MCTIFFSMIMSLLLYLFQYFVFTFSVIGNTVFVINVDVIHFSVVPCP